jgi:hypothetical protein
VSEEYVELQLTQGKVAKVSINDFQRVSKWSWHFDGRYARGYPHGIKEYLHRYINQPKSNEVVDHINGDRLDCRRVNLRNCSHSINSSNKHVTKNKHGLMGVYERLDYPGTFRAEIYYLGKKYGLGTHKTAEAAHDAYLRKKSELHII